MHQHAFGQLNRQRLRNSSGQEAELVDSCSLASTSMLGLRPPAADRLFDDATCTVRSVNVRLCAGSADAIRLAAASATCRDPSPPSESPGSPCQASQPWRPIAALAASRRAGRNAGADRNASWRGCKDAPRPCRGRRRASASISTISAWLSRTRWPCDWPPTTQARPPSADGDQRKRDPRHLPRPAAAARAADNRPARSAADRQSSAPRRS